MPDPSAADLALSARVRRSQGQADTRAVSLGVADASEEMLFDVAPLDPTRCHARVFQQKRLDRPVFAQCSERQKVGSFCGKHGRGQPQGIWDPPGHATLPAAKLAEGRLAVQLRTRGSTSVPPRERSRAASAGSNRLSSNAMRGAPGLAPLPPGESSRRAVAGSDGFSADTPRGAPSLNAASVGTRTRESFLKRRRGTDGVSSGAASSSQFSAGVSSGQQARIVSGFDEGRVEDVAADERRGEGERGPPPRTRP